MSMKRIGTVVAGWGARAGRWSRRRTAAKFVLVAVVLLAIVVVVGMVVTALTPPQPQAQPIAGTTPAQPTASRATAQARPSSSPVPLPRGGLARSEPVHITVSKIGVAADVMALGVDRDARPEVPPLEKAYLAGWYRLGPAPGEIGNAVIVGHVDSHAGPAVFFRLNTLRPGDTIAVSRRDNTVTEFTVDEVKSYPKIAFPTALVYGPAQKPALRLVTCGGQFDPEKRSYEDNVVVFATGTSWHKA